MLLFLAIKLIKYSINKLLFRMIRKQIDSLKKKLYLDFIAIIEQILTTESIFADEIITEAHLVWVRKYIVFKSL